MCDFFSCITKGDGKLIYFDEDKRKKIYEGGFLNANVYYISDLYELDSHSSIARYFGLDCDEVNKYEYNPITKEFSVDQINARINDSRSVRRKLEKLDYSKLIYPTIIFKEEADVYNNGTTKVRKKDIKLLKEWAQVRASKHISISSYLSDRFDNILSGVEKRLIEDITTYSYSYAYPFIRNNKGSAYYTERSLWDALYAYKVSYINLDYCTKGMKNKDGGYIYQSVVDLFERGLIPSFDGKAWSLHGRKAKVLKTISKEELFSL